MAFRDGALVVVLGLCLLYVKGGEGAESQDKEHSSRHDLMTHLLGTHNPLVIPSTPLKVSYKLDLLAIEGVDEKENILRISAFATVFWSDHRFQWDPANYSGILSASLPKKAIWHPDLELLYSQVEEIDDINLRVFPDGFVGHYLPMRLAIPCSFDFNDYPYDAHTCDIRVESWTNPGSMLNLTLGGASAAGTWYHRVNSQWEIQSFTANKTVDIFPPSPEQYIYLTFRLQFKRTVGEYEIRAVVPSVITSLLILLCFLIPPLSGGRMVLCSVVILCILLQLYHLNLTVPIRGPNAPFLADFLCFSVILAVFAAVESVVSMNLSSWGTLSGSGNNNNNSNAPKDGEELVAQPKPSLFLMQLARIIDLVCFVIFTITFAIGGGIILNPKTE